MAQVIDINKTLIANLKKEMALYEEEKTITEKAKHDWPEVKRTYTYYAR